MVIFVENIFQPLLTMDNYSQPLSTMVISILLMLIMITMFNYVNVSQSWPTMLNYGHLCSGKVYHGELWSSMATFGHV